MRTFLSFATILIGSFSTFAPSSLGEPIFPKGAEVRLTKDEPLLFKNQETRIGKAGERFTVIQHDTSSKRVFVLVIDAAGKQVAFNVAENAVEFAPLDVAKLRRVLVLFADKGDLVNAAATAESAAVKAPDDTRVQEYRSSIATAKAAYDKVSAAAKKAEDVKIRVAQLSKSAWAARNNFLDPNGGFARSQEMKAEAEKLIGDSNTEIAKAKTEWASAKTALSSLLRKPIAASQTALALTGGLIANIVVDDASKIGSTSIRPHSPQFKSNSEALALTGIWVVDRGGGSTQVSIGMQNMGTRPIKAFRAKLNKRNDFGEENQVLELEYSSESEYESGLDRLMNQHLILPKETVFLNQLTFGNAPSKTNYSSISFIRAWALAHGKSKIETDDAENQLLADGNFILEVTEIVKGVKP